jgi:transposase-like protein
MPCGRPRSSQPTLAVVSDVDDEVTPRWLNTSRLGRSQGGKARVGRRSKYPEEFRQRAAPLVLDSRCSVRDVAGKLGLDHETLRNWGAAERQQGADGSTALTVDELFELPGCGRSPRWNLDGRS